MLYIVRLTHQHTRVLKHDRIKQPHFLEIPHVNAKKDIAPALISSLDNTSRLLSHSTQDLGQRTHTVACYNKQHRAPRSTHGHLDDIENLPHKDVTSPKR